MGYLMGIDLGTSSVKTIIIEENGSVKGTAQTSYDISLPKANYAEQDPEEWWKATVNTIRLSLKMANIDPRDIKSIGLSGQMHGMVLIDKEFKVIRPAVIWSDQRTKNEIDYIYSILGKNFVGEETLNALSPGFQTPSLLWIKNHEPESFEKIYKVLLPKDYIRLKLTNIIGTDFTDASSTLAFNTKERKWSKTIINNLNLYYDHYPEVRESTDIAGEVSSVAAEVTGLRYGTKVVYGGGDQSMQAIGNGIVKPGQISLTIGTGGQAFAVTKHPVYDKKYRTHTFCNAIPGTWNIMGATLAAGLSLNWLNKRILSNLSYKEINRLADTVNLGSDGLVFLPYLIGERTPYWDSSAKGTFMGLTLKHDKGHLIRSVMEGVTFSLKDSVEILKTLDVKMDQFIASGGGAQSKVWLQIQANILNQEIYTVDQPEQACLGAAITAGVGVGLYESIEKACHNIVQLSGDPVTPDPVKVKAYSRIYSIYKDIYQANKEIFKKMG